MEPTIGDVWDTIPEDKKHEFYWIVGAILFSGPNDEIQSKYDAATADGLTQLQLDVVNRMVELAIESKNSKTIVFREPGV